MANKKKRTKKEILRSIKNVVLIILGCAVLAFGDAAFIAPLELVTGGVLSVGVIIQHFVNISGNSGFNVVDIVTWIMQVILLIVSFIFLGKKFTLRTLFATLLYPLLLSLFMRIPVGGYASIGEAFSSQFTKQVVESAQIVDGQLVTVSSENYALTILGGIVGGACVGAGVAVTYHGDGSTGGLDVISVIIAKHTSIKEALSAFVLDGTLVIIGMCCTRDIPRGFIGILSALVCALAVQFVYVNTTNFVIVDIISKEEDAIRKYVEDELDRTTTLIEVTGGYTGSSRTLMRVCLSKRQVIQFRQFIAEMDPRAFVTITQASMINGEGFDPLCKPKMADLVSPDLTKNETKTEEETDGR